MKILLNACLGIGVAVLLCTCSGPSAEPVKVRFHLQRPVSRGLLPQAADYPCFGLIVTGEGIPSLQPGSGNRFPADHCPYAGASSTFVPLKSVGGVDQATVEAMVPAGRNRLIQVVGLEYTSATQCPTGKVARFLKDTNEGNGPIGYGGMYEVGYKIADLFTDAEIQVPRTYDTTTAFNLLGCAPSPEGLQIWPRGNIRVRINSYTYFQASGGRPPYVYTKFDHGTINPGTGAYLAYNVAGDVDSVTVTDADGRVASTNLTTFDATVPPFWVAAEQFGNTAGANVSAWSNLGSGGSFTAIGAPTFIPSAINGFPAVRLAAGDKYYASPGTLTLDGVDALIVARLVFASVGNIFCIAPSGTCGTSLFRLYSDGGMLVRGSVSDGVGSSLTGNLFSGSNFFVAEMKTDLSVTNAQGVKLTIGNNTINGGVTLSALSLPLVGATSKIFLGGPTTGYIDIAEFVLDYSSSSVASRLTTLNYLKAKYQLP